MATWPRRHVSFLDKPVQKTLFRTSFFLIRESLFHLFSRLHRSNFHFVFCESNKGGVESFISLKKCMRFYTYVAVFEKRIRFFSEQPLYFEKTNRKKWTQRCVFWKIKKIRECIFRIRFLVFFFFIFKKRTLKTHPRL